MRCVIPPKITVKIFNHLHTVQKAARILWSPFDGAKEGLHKRIVVGGPGASKQPGLLVIVKHPFYRF